MDKAGGFATPDPNTLALALAQLQSPILIPNQAGGYGIQGFAGAFVKKINGCYHNVVRPG